MRGTKSKVLTKLVQPYDPRCSHFSYAIKLDIDGLRSSQTWAIVSSNSLPAFENTLGGRFVLNIRSGGTKNEIWKARFVVRGYRDSMKSSIVCSIAVARQFSTKIIISVASIKSLRLFSTDGSQEYIQSEEKLQREVFVMLCKKFVLEEAKLIKLNKPLYGLAESRDY